ncbi:cellulase family glycosylhydrolase [Polyangium sp. 15x6]|uniref:glycoside hydrolase 5 family protein n=1 Tax=Polyangium sp. 15x6 TaxID=3042687 RepID=UPI002499F20C|nr:cellulase family glycosylhydrolase [Polyangium sp. 15x6]MDI3288478.1 cellulase family glycosylhydrolase [Polyangium sp. 15x6]
MRYFGAMLACAMTLHAETTSASGFVRVAEGRFQRDGRPYTFLGANFWYGMNLGAEGPSGNPGRLARELDRLAALGVTNLRILAATEGPEPSPWRILPVLQPSPREYREEILLGLDFLLKEMKARGMVAVVCLNNFWPWSGGMAQYLRWSGAGPIPYPPPEPGGSWSAYQAYTAAFYSNPAAVEAFHDFVRMLLQRTNRYTGVRYADDPTIMAWELANEPRGGTNVKAFQSWIERTSELLESLDSRHLVTTGSEGETPWPRESGLDVVANHRFSSIDYVTAHVWAQNWGWYDPARPKSYEAAVREMKSYLRRHIEHARRLGKPLVVEEFGFPRDAGSHDPAATTATRDRYYRAVFDVVLDAVRAGEPVGGVNFWAWSGEGRPRIPGGHWQKYDPFTGDPPHEAQGWYGVYDTDDTTLRVIAEYARKIASNSRPSP